MVVGVRDIHHKFRVRLCVVLPPHHIVCRMQRRREGYRRIADSLYLMGDRWFPAYTAVARSGLLAF